MSEFKDGKDMSELYYEKYDNKGTAGGVPVKIKVDIFSVIDKKDVWELKPGTKIISLVGVQKLADNENIVEKKFQTEITPSEGNKQQHAVNIWVGYKGDNNPDNWCRGSGEASVLNTGKVVMAKEGRRYEEFNSVDSKYRYSMADKRAYCRAVCKLLKLYGVYTEVEAAGFWNPAKIANYDY